MSAKPDDIQRLSHILQAIERIERFTEDMSFDDFQAHEMAQFAVIKNFEIVGEAAYQISNELKMEHSNVEWRKIEAFRHILVHEYYRIDMMIVWNAIEEKIIDLKIEIEAILQHKN